jgi:hypothetical protein
MNMTRAAPSAQETDSLPASASAGIVLDTKAKRQCPHCGNASHQQSLTNAKRSRPSAWKSTDAAATAAAASMTDRRCTKLTFAGLYRRGPWRGRRPRPSPPVAPTSSRPVTHTSDDDPAACAPRARCAAAMPLRLVTPAARNSATIGVSSAAFRLTRALTASPRPVVPPGSSGSRAMLTAIRRASSGVNHQHRDDCVR